MLVMRTLTRSWRWPRLRREFLRRRFLKEMTFGPRVCLDELGDDLGAGNERAAEFGFVAADHEDFGELDLGAGVAGDLFDGDDVVSSNTVLLAARLDDSVHGYSFNVIRALWRRSLLRTL